MAVQPPTGTVTFLFTDIEGSTSLWEERPDEMRVALAEHDAIIRGAVDDHGGYIFSTAGDGFAAAFQRAADAVGAAVKAQAALTGNELIRVRMGVHTGEVLERGGDYFGPAVNRAARIMAAGHGGQMLVSAITAALIGTAGLIDLGEHGFAGLATPERVFQVGHAVFPPLRSFDAVPSNLPAERSPFVGRDRELAVVAGLVRGARMVMLTGVGGVGKTRLAVNVGRGLRQECPGGVWFVDLTPLVDAALVATAVASAVGAPSSPSIDAVEVVCRYLAQRRALVILDNCEHVIDAAADLVDTLLSRAPRVRILATSREPLGVEGETVWRVPSLTVDAVDGGMPDAVELFTARAAQVQPGFEADALTFEAALAVCRRLDGIPLAIELAAARVNVLSVEQIASRLDERFRLLVRGARTAVPRQQTLQNAIDWSYDLLTAREQELFDSLSVFAGHFDLEAAAAVAGVDELDALDEISQLVTKSMVEADPTHDRYRLLETLRQYGWDRLARSGRLAAARDAHAARFSDLARRQNRVMQHSAITALDRLESDYDNLRSALMHLIEQRRAEDACRLVRRLGGLFNIRHPREGLLWFERVLAIAEPLTAETKSGLLASAAFAAMNAGDGPSTARYARQAVELGGDGVPAAGYYVLGQNGLRTGDPHALRHFEKAVTRAAETDDLTIRACATASLVEVYAKLGDEAKCRHLLAEALALTDRLGNPTITAANYLTACCALSGLDHPDEALGMLQRALLHAETGGPIMTVSSRSAHALLLDNARDAAGEVRTAIAVAREQLVGNHQLPPLLATAKILAQVDQPELAARLVGCYQRHTGVLNYWLGELWLARLKGQLIVTLGTDVYDAVTADGAHLTNDEALRLAAESLDALP